MNTNEWKIMLKKEDIQIFIEWINNEYYLLPTNTNKESLTIGDIYEYIVSKSSKQFFIETFEYIRQYFIESDYYLLYHIVQYNRPEILKYMFEKKYIDFEKIECFDKVHIYRLIFRNKYYDIYEIIKY